MVYRKLLVLAVFGFGSGMLSAATPWFDAGIKDYESWPTDGSDRVVTGAGTWSNTADAKLEGVEGQRMLAIDSIQSVTFSSAVSKTVADQGSAGVLVATRVRFSVCDDLPEITADQKGSLTVLNDGEGLSYRGLVANAEGTANVWAKLTGAVPKEDDFVTLEVSIRRGAAGLNQIRYVIDGVALLNNGAEWSDIVFPADDDQVTGCAYTGNGTVAALSGAAGEAAGPMQLLTIPALENISVAHVKVAGVEILPNAEGKYAVEKGALVTVTFAPASGWALDVSTMSFVVCDDMTLPETGRPNAINVAAAIVINEVMAKNGVTLKTKKGYAELDWVELYNKGDEDADLSGWYFYNDPTAKKSKWTLLQGDCVVPAKGYKIVWCDKDMLCPDDGFAADEAFVRFNISTTAGKTLFLATPEGDITTQLPLPGGIKDISYGLGHLSRTIVAQNAAAQYKVGDGEWKNVDGAIGMSATESGFEVTEYSIGKQVSNMDVAEACLLDSTTWKATPVTTRQGKIAFASNGSTGNFSGYAAFPTYNADDTILVAKGTVLVPETGDWSFAVGSDDGFTAKLSRLGQSWSWESRGARGYAQSVATFNLEAGAYAVELVYFNRSGGRIVDFSAAQGRLAFDADTFALVGSGAVLHAGALGAQIAADVSEEMVGKAVTADWKTTFVLDEAPAAGDTFRLLMRYADGFTAKLNGKVVASAPVAKRPAAAAMLRENFTLAASDFVVGENVLEVTGTNDAIGDQEFFLSPELVWDIAEDLLVYFEEPTPGAANAANGKTGFTPVVTFSEPHGWKEATFDLALSCAANPNAVIYYTLDGTAPVIGAEGTFRYDAPIAVDKTTVVRAAVPDVDSILQQDASATYLFLEDVLKQSATPPEGYPADKAVNSQAVRYGMNKLITEGDADTQARLRKGFTESIATVSLVIDPKHLFDPSKGIYVNASGNGRGWERPTMVEQIDPTGACDFNVPAGLRIRGAYSRGAGYPKHSFRLFFRSEYGMGTLEQPLFGDEGDDEFEKIDLRTEQNYSWANGSEWETFVHEVFARDSQRDMGEPYNRSRYLHLFINGIYWGLYQTEERVDQNYCKSYNGGVAENYDVIRTSQPGYNTGVVEGESAAWEALWRITTKEGYGEGHEANYYKVLGLDPDGTPNPEYPVLLNVTNLVTYMITSQFAADTDTPANTSGMANNIIAFRNRVAGEGQRAGFLWNRHDAEHSLSRGGSANAGTAALLYGTRGGANKSLDIGNFNPAELHYELCQNAEYRRVFADLVYKHLLKTGGAMTAPVAEARFRVRMAELDDAIVCETARWGNGSSKRTRATWLNNCNDAIKFINQRTPYLIQAYRTLGWYPTVDAAAVIDGAGAPVTEGATVAADASLYLTVPADATAYYTTDGSDPLAADGTPSAAALAYSGASPVPVETPVFAKGAEWKYYDAGDKPAANWAAADYDASSWKAGAGKLGYGNDAGTCATALDRFVGGGSSGTQVVTYYFRKSFTLPKGAEALTSLKAALDCDDGYIAYVNGVEVGRDQVSSDAYEAFSTATNMGAKESTWTFPAGTLKEGANVIAVEVHQCNERSSDAWWDLALAYFAPGNVEGGLSVPTAGLTLNVRVLKDGEWSALETVSVLGELPKATPVEALRVAEIMSSSASKLDSDDYLVLTNVTDGVVTLEGVKIVAWNAKKNSESKPSLTYLFGAGERLMPGEALKLTNLDKLTNSQVGLRIYDAEGALVQDCFVDADWWDSACDESGVSFVPRTYGAEAKTIDDWKPSVSWVERALRFAELDGIPADGLGGDTGEYVVLTNISDTVTLDLTGVVVNIGKADDMAVDETTSKCLFTLGEMALAPNASVRLDQATYWNGKKQKITNGALVMKIYDAEGACAQVSSVDQNDAAFANYKAKASGTAAGPVLKATSFARELTTSDWTEYVPPAPQDWPEDPDTEIADTAVASDLGITSGSFATATPAELRKLSKWAKTHTVPYAGEAVNAMSFASPTVFEEAYLLNCAPQAEAVAQKKAAFRFTEIVPGVEPTVEGDFNGTVRVLGAETLEGPWTEGNANAHFFKATLAR